MTREEWKFTLSKASLNISKEIVDLLKHNISPSQETLIAQEIINQIFKAL